MKLALMPWLVASGLFFGCGDDAGLGGAGGGGGADAGGGSGAGVVDPTPILEREPAISHDCTEERPMTQESGVTTSRLEGLVAAGGVLFATHSAETLSMAKVELDGAVGDPLVLESESFAFRVPVTIADGDDVVTVWAGLGGQEQLIFARVDSTLALVDGPTGIPETAGNGNSAAALVPADGGFALLYGAVSGSQTELTFLRIGPDGTAAGEPVAVANLGETYGASASAAPTEDGGFAVTYAVGTPLDSDVYFVVLEADGSPRFTPRRISRAGGDGVASYFSYYSRNNVLPVGDAFWVTFTEGESDYETEQGHSIIRVAVVDVEGSATLHGVQAPVEGIENRYPSFVEFDGRIGLFWTTGHIIWVCGGCITDYDMLLVLLDPETVVPASQVVTHLHMTNGINAPIVAVQGSDLLTGSNLDFHALTLPATGAMRCVAAE